MSRFIIQKFTWRGKHLNERRFEAKLWKILIFGQTSPLVRVRFLKNLI